MTTESRHRPNGKQGTSAMHLATTRGAATMRMLLLASAAALAATTATPGLASAQTLPAPQPQTTLAAPQLQTLVKPNGGASQSTNNNSQAADLPGSVANPTPGSFVVRLNGGVWTEFDVSGSSANDASVTKGTTTTLGKLNTQNMATFIRLYPGFDAMAANGLRYGAAVEIRENFVGNATTTNSNGASGVTSGQTLYVRRAFLYLATDQAGILRIGQADGVTGLMDNGVVTFKNFDTGGWTGDHFPIPSNMVVTFPFFTGHTAEYGNAKFVYLSPQFGGVDLGLQYAPNAGNGAYSCAYAGAVSATAGTCPALSSSSTLGDGARFTNQYVAGARYQGSFGPVGVYAVGTYTGSGSIDYTGPAPASAAIGGYNGKFDDLSVGFVGGTVTYAGLTVGGSLQGGRFNGSYALQPENGVHGRAWLAGAQYAAGPLVAGVSFFNYQSQGAVALTNISQRSENGLDVGGTYNIAPGLWGFAQYLYGTRHQGNFDFVAATTGAANNNVQAQILILGTKVRW